MMIAKVIVDIPVKETDRPFDYKIPLEFESFIQPGMRVLVPFGPMKRLGFILSIETQSEIKNLKSISQVIDPTPVLTKELLSLGKWLSTETLCPRLFAYSAMLPAVLKGNYKKMVRINDQVSLAREFPTLLDTLLNKPEMEWTELLKKEPEQSDSLNAAMKKGFISIIQWIKNDRRTYKKIRYIATSLSKDELIDVTSKLDKRSLKQKQVLEYFINQEPHLKVEISDILKRLNVGRSTLKQLVKKGFLDETTEEVYRDPYADKEIERTTSLSLTTAQKNALAPIQESIRSQSHEVFLCHGVTGSGKTEIYLQAIEKILNMGKEAIVLVPEIALTPQMVHRFKGRFGDEVAVLHSGLSQGEKYDEWRKIHEGAVHVVVGARSAIFAPFKNLGLIIIDEEHETSYKQEEQPRYHARDVAIFRGKYHQCPVVLGSATPSLESYARAKKGVYHLIQLLERVNQRSLPEVQLVDMREELRSNNHSMFSKQLFERLEDRLEKKEQSVLFLNRRGYSTFVMCRDCGYVVQCPHCDISLTYHRKQGMLKCHYCGHQEPYPSQCPECTSHHLRYFGTGTQRVEEELTKVLPEARVIRMDVDTTQRKGSHEKLLKAFGEGKADILLGTQMIAKGLDFPKVTLVGVLAADAMLHLPDFRSSEKTFQLLTQVSGRAGRDQLPGEVIIQSYSTEHYSIIHASYHDYHSFYDQEMQMRYRHHYPPFYYLALITLSHPQVTKVVDIAEKIAGHLKKGLSSDAQILGPTSSAIPRIKDRYRYQCMVKYKREPNLLALLKRIQEHYPTGTKNDDLKITIDLNPFIMM
ncbi:primosomal protein N' [Terrilactibacillus laevilacticus]|uniref:Replication restart protein PriA n=1 Tax=Terrilactibacillus laevilacticus TaxID=1380157 RepID=A0ABW5PPY1_9BACI|nr:primosomal protein N' [Terrilactibacillus laevilacticus]